MTASEFNSLSISAQEQLLEEQGQLVNTEISEEGYDGFYEFLLFDVIVQYAGTEIASIQATEKISITTPNN